MLAMSPDRTHSTQEYSYSSSMVSTFLSTSSGRGRSSTFFYPLFVALDGRAQWHVQTHPVQAASIPRGRPGHLKKGFALLLPRTMVLDCSCMHASQHQAYCTGLTSLHLRFDVLTDRPLQVPMEIQPYPVP